MMRWVMVLLVIGAIYWLYENGYYNPKMPARPTGPTTSEPLQPPSRPGGGLNPFVMDDDIDAPPQRPHAPSVP